MTLETIVIYLEIVIPPLWQKETNLKKLEWENSGQGMHWEVI